MLTTADRLKVPPEDPPPHWRQWLFTGAPGTVLLLAEYARAGLGDWDAVHRWAAAMIAEPVNVYTDACGLDRGAPAVAYTLRAAGHRGYTRAVAQLDIAIAETVRRRLDRAHRRIDRGLAPALREFDLIGGLTGLGAYLLQATPIGCEPFESISPGSNDVYADGAELIGVLEYLVRLTEPLRIDGVELPGWWTRDSPTASPSVKWPGGHLNLGMAHGCSGILALLSTAMRHGVTVRGQADAIMRICNELDRWKVDDGRELWWPGTVSRAWQDFPDARRSGPPRPSWCYGTPGIARAQQLAGLALDDSRRKAVAELALIRCLADPGQLALLGDASLCHGWAGVLQTVRRAVADAEDDSDLATHLPVLREGLQRHLDHYGDPATAGLLTGLPGVLLVRHSTAPDPAPTSSWDACLLLAG